MQGLKAIFYCECANLSIVNHCNKNRLLCAQVQGLMDIFDCEWANLYIWTSQRGSAGAPVVRTGQVSWLLLS